MTQDFFVLHELRLTTGDLATRLLVAARIAGMTQAEDEQVLPMLVSIDDGRDVACVRRVHALPGVDDDAGVRIRKALGTEPESSGPPRYYNERAAIAGERGTQSYYRMAVTESGTNDHARTVADMPALPRSLSVLPQTCGAAVEGVFWIVMPVASEICLLLFQIG